MSCGFAPIRVMTGAVVSTTLTVRVTSVGLVAVGVGDVVGDGVFADGVEQDAGDCRR